MELCIICCFEGKLINIQGLEIVEFQHEISEFTIPVLNLTITFEVKEVPHGCL